MKKLLIVLAIFIGNGITVAQAQEGKKVAGAKRMTDSMTVRLGLNADQVPKVLAINEEFNTRAASIKTEGGDRVEKLKRSRRLIRSAKKP
ncbi:hypothetical protein [Paraflavitalea speifideaquila]|uniref:hypothetical protein n=1 Tax=Paraflavitalea speifideaquila TaxID=3076558 RepID=UPI0028EE462D|nr:hypothetical protein [Paraflavitalea speifideiaquila]